MIVNNVSSQKSLFLEKYVFVSSFARERFNVKRVINGKNSNINNGIFISDIYKTIFLSRWQILFRSMA